MTNTYRWIVATLLSAHLANAVADEIDCEKAITRIDKLLCSNVSGLYLQTLDTRLNAYYKKIISTGSGSVASELIQSQHMWITSIRDKCENEACLSEVYLSRLMQLRAFGIPEDVDEDDPEDFCVKNDMPPGGAACTQYINSRTNQSIDADLNREYKRLIGSMPKRESELLRRAQRKWLKQRNAHCKKEIKREWGGSCGTTWCVVAEDDCITDGNLKRLNELREMLKAHGQ